LISAAADGGPATTTARIRHIKNSLTVGFWFVFKKILLL